MRSHAKTQSTRAGGRLRLTLLLATAAAFLLVPAAGAAANGTLTVETVGPGSGEVTSLGGFQETGVWEGEEPIECAWNGATEEQSGTCVTELELSGEEPGIEAIYLTEANAAPDSELVFANVEEGIDISTLFFPPGGVSYCAELIFNPAPGGGSCFPGVETGEGNATILVAFECEGGEEPCPPEPPEPVNVIAHKSGTGEGWIKSTPPGINCGLPCENKLGEFAEGEEVTLSAYGAQFDEWEVCPGTITGNECAFVVEGPGPVEATAKFTAPADEVLLVHKTGDGEGWVKSTPSGINCGLPCTDKAGFFPNGEVVKLSAYGAQFKEWTECPGTINGNMCEGILMDATKEATVEFDDPEVP